MSSETRTFRPFDIDARLSRVFKWAEFAYGDKRCADGGRVLLEDSSFGLRTPVITWAPEDRFEEFKHNLAAGAVDTGIDRSHMRLSVVARSSYLKLSEVVYSHALDDIASIAQSVELGTHRDGSRRSVFSAETNGAEVDAYVTLRSSLPEKPLRPHQQATWLARASFRIVCGTSEHSLFRPTPLNDETRSRLGLAQGTARFVEFESGDLADTADRSLMPTFWVDETLLTALDRSLNSQVAVQLQLQLALDFISAVVFEFSRQAADEGHPHHNGQLVYEDVKNSLIGKIVKLAAGQNATNEQRDRMLKDCLRDPGKVVAWAEDAVKTHPAMLKALEH